MQTNPEVGHEPCTGCGNPDIILATDLRGTINLHDPKTNQAVEWPCKFTPQALQEILGITNNEAMRFTIVPGFAHQFITRNCRGMVTVKNAQVCLMCRLEACLALLPCATW